ncbi:DDE-type integrase/transposase/recombinase [Rickettsiales endosymbiont of Trichoplax sp. H2]|uniref:DDE-type integrase/transposase/recombinase n=1 Tax=Rickettsiales endosymbiont of Trichoplax sp. H2 TaxID=2021221 RepID=UPI0034DDB560
MKKKQRKITDKWNLDEMTIRINGKYFILWRAVDSQGYELDVLMQKRCNKKISNTLFIKVTEVTSCTQSNCHR